MPAPGSSVRPPSAGAILVVGLALALLLVPLPADAIESWYSNGVYLRLQRVVTPVSNLVPVALFDPAAAALILLGLLALRTRVRRHGVGRAALQAAGGILVATAAAYLIFLAMWGLNYRRVALEAKLDYDPARITRDAARALATEAVRRVNERRPGAVAAPADDDALALAFQDVVVSLGAPRPPAIGRVKPSLLGLYFRQAAIDGMTNPFFHEIILNPDLLPPERPMVLAHEWAHLAGYAHETEANFVAWLTCLRADAPAAYSAWLAAYEHGVRALSREDHRSLPPLDEGPRSDLRAMAARYERSSPVVRTAAREAYDSYLRANRVEEGIAAYGAVVRLMLGTIRDGQDRPRLRQP